MGHGSQTRRPGQGRGRGHHSVAGVGGAVAEMWGEGPKQLPLAQGPELQHWPSQKQAPALCPRAREKAGGPEEQEEASWLISTVLSPSLPWGPGDLSPRSQGPGPPLQGGVGEWRQLGLVWSRQGRVLGSKEGAEQVDSRDRPGAAWQPAASPTQTSALQDMAPGSLDPQPCGLAGVKTA